MSSTARMVMKIVGASLGLAAFICLLIGGWHDLEVGAAGARESWNRRFGRSEYDDYEDDELFQ